MEHAEHLDHIRRGGDALLEAATGNLDRAVPTCPGWDLERLVTHAGGAVSYWRLQAEQGPDGQPVRDDDLPAAPAGVAVLAWFRDEVGSAVAVLATMDTKATWPTFLGPQLGTVHARRLAHELAIHRWDAQNALGDPQAIDADLAVDGVDEHLELFAPLFADSLPRSGTIHLHATDSALAEDAGEWLVTLRAQSPSGSAAITFEHGHAKGDVAVRGSASDLLLLLWNRVSARRPLPDLR